MHKDRFSTAVLAACAAAGLVLAGYNAGLQKRAAQLRRLEAQVNVTRLAVYRTKGRAVRYRAAVLRWNRVAREATAILEKTTGNAITLGTACVAVARDLRSKLDACEGGKATF